MLVLHRRSKEDQKLLKEFNACKRVITWIQIKVYVWVHSLILRQQMYAISSLFYLSSILCRYSVLLLTNINSGTWYGEKTLYFWVLPFHWDAKWCCWRHCLRAWWGGMSYFPVSMCLCGVRIRSSDIRGKFIFHLIVLVFIFEFCCPIHVSGLQLLLKWFWSCFRLVTVVVYDSMVSPMLHSWVHVWILNVFMMSFQVLYLPSIT